MKPGTELPWSRDTGNADSQQRENWQPGTPLVWEQTENALVIRAERGGPRIATCHLSTDAAYIVHASNAYPKLVEALRECTECLLDQCPVDCESRALLAELGE